MKEIESLFYSTENLHVSTQMKILTRVAKQQTGAVLLSCRWGVVVCFVIIGYIYDNKISQINAFLITKPVTACMTLRFYCYHSSHQSIEASSRPASTCIIKQWQHLTLAMLGWLAGTDTRDLGGCWEWDEVEESGSCWRCWAETVKTENVRTRRDGRLCLFVCVCGYV